MKTASSQGFQLSCPESQKCLGSHCVEHCKRVESKHIHVTCTCVVCLTSCLVRHVLHVRMLNISVTVCYLAWM